MKKILFVVSCGLFVFSAYGQQIINLVTGEIKTKSLAEEPVRTEEPLNDGFLVTYDFHEAYLSEEPDYPNCVMWNIPGFLQKNDPGFPSIPFQNDWFEIGNFIPSVEIVECNYVDYQYQLPPAIPVQPISSETYEKVKRIPINSFDGFYPKSVVESNGFSLFLNEKYACFRISPVQYNYEQKTVRAYTRITYKITLSIDGGKRRQKSSCVLKKLVNGNEEKDYLVITTNKFKSAVDNFVELERLMGFNVIVRTDDNWNCEKVRNTVKTVYEETNGTLYALLIVGDHQDVPSNIISAKDTLGYSLKQHVTDLYYACMDTDSPDFPNLLYGRIPVSTNNGAQIVVNKLYDYVLNPVTDVDFYNKGIHCTNFESNNGVYEDYRYMFAWTSEKIRDIMQQEIGKNIKRIYHSDNSNSVCVPKYYNDWKTELPKELQTIDAWQGNASDIINAVNEGAFYVNYNGHGNVTAWGSPRFDINDVKKLNNGNKLPIVFCNCCLNGKFDNNSFCEAVLQSEKGGAIGTIGATESSWSKISDCFEFGIFDAIWPECGFKYCYGSDKTITAVPTFELGQIKNQGYVHMEITYKGDPKIQYIKEIYHLFGDPCMRIYTDVPTEFSQAQIVRNAHSISVDLGNEYGRIVFYNPKTGDVFRKESESAVYETNTPNDVIVCVTGHNKRALIDDRVNIDTIKYEGIYYQLADGEATLIPTKGDSYTGSISVPEKIWSRGKPYIVTGIQRNAFKNAEIKSVKFPKNIRTLPVEVFGGCKELLSADLSGVNVERLPNYAFDGCKQLKSVIMSDSIVSIGNNAFRGCTSLQSIELPSQLKTIGIGSFERSGLETIYIPDGVTIIDNQSFKDCFHLKHVILNQNLEQVGENAFAGCDSIWLMECHAMTPPDCAPNSFSETCYNSTYLFVPIDAYDTYEVSPSWKDFSGMDIQDFDFYCNGLFFRIVKDNQVKVASAGWYHENLYSGDVMIPYDTRFNKKWYEVIGVDDYAFSFSPNLTSVFFENSYNLEIGRGAFSDCWNLEKVTLPRDQKSIRKGTFESCLRLKTIDFPADLDSIEDMAFMESGLESVYIPESVKFIGQSAFKGCFRLKKAGFPNNTSYEELSPSVFEGCSNLMDVALSDNLTTINEKAFKNCSKLTNFFVPANISFIGKEAFAGCRGMQEFYSSAKTPFVEDASVFTGIDKETCVVRVPKRLQYYALMDGWKDFKNIRLVQYDFRENGICYNLNSGNSLSVTYADETYNSYSGNVVIPSSVSLHGKEYNVKSIDAKAFYQSKGLTHVSIPSSVTAIGDSAFANCTNLQYVDFSDEIESIGIRAFMNCKSLTEIVLPKKLKTLDERAFFNCSNLENIEFGNALETIGKSAFSYNRGLTTLEFPKSLKSIAKGSFSNCSLLKTISIYSDVLMGENAFSGCGDLTSVFNYASQPNSIKKNAFDVSTYNNATLFVPVGCDSVFQNLTGWNSFNIAETGSNCLVDGIFYMLTSSTAKVVASPDNRKWYSGDIVIPEKILHNGKIYKVNLIGDSAFSNSEDLRTVIIPATVAKVGKMAFANCENLSAICCQKSSGATSCDATSMNGVPHCILYVPEGYAGPYKSKGWKLSNIDVMDGCTIDGMIFTLDVKSKIATVWKSIDLGDGIVEIPQKIMPRKNEYTVRKISNNAFRDSELKKVVIPKTVSEIGENAFRNCTSLEKVVIESNQLSIADSALYGCRNLMAILCKTLMPPQVGPNTFNSPETWVYVQREKVLAYQNNWPYYASRIVGMGASYNVYVDGIFYLCDYSTGTATVSYEMECGNSYSGNVVIPEMVVVGTTKYRVNAIGEKAFFNCHDLVSVSIPDGVSSIGDYAFYDCSAINAIRIPSSVTKVGEETFYGCSSLAWVHSLSVSPPICGNGAFSEIASKCELVVPYNCEQNYRNADVWKNFYRYDESASSMMSAEMRSIFDEADAESEDGTTGIEELKTAAKVVKPFTLDGRVATDGAHGIVVRGGKKIISNHK